jgi:hypothetical protein
MPDSTQETLDHIERVRDLISSVVAGLYKRAHVHDASKLQEPEKSAFDTLSQKLKDVTYGSEEYRSALREIKPALQHHYAHNAHHPEHWENGILDMSLLDLIEMFADWKAATERMKDGGDLGRSLLLNKDRFGIDDQLYYVLVNTAMEMKWIKERPALTNTHTRPPKND